jgi:outer membrane lipoprotein SlyB
MMTARTRFIVVLAAIATLGACAPNVSPSSYSVGSVGQVNRAVRGTVLSARLVAIEGNQSGVGATAGAGVGAVGGSRIGGDTRSNIIGAIGGAVIGGLVGSGVEASATKQQGIEYVVQTENSALLTVVQGEESLFKEGDRVIVLYGQRSRIIADTTSK